MRRISSGSPAKYMLWRNERFQYCLHQAFGVILFEKLGLPAIKKTKTGYSTDIEVLEKLHDQHPIIEKIIEYRQPPSSRVPILMDSCKQSLSADQKVHTTFNQVATATGAYFQHRTKSAKYSYPFCVECGDTQCVYSLKPENCIVSGGLFAD